MRALRTESAPAKPRNTPATATRPPATATTAPTNTGTPRTATPTNTVPAGTATRTASPPNTVPAGTATRSATPSSTTTTTATPAPPTATPMPINKKAVFVGNVATLPTSLGKRGVWKVDTRNVYVSPLIWIERSDLLSVGASVWVYGSRRADGSVDAVYVRVLLRGRDSGGGGGGGGSASPTPTIPRPPKNDD